MRFTAAPAPRHAPQSGPECSAPSAAQGSPWRQTSNAAVHPAQAVRTDVAPTMSSPASSAWPAGAQGSAKAAWGQAAAPHLPSGSVALQTPSRGCVVAQRPPQRRVMRSLDGALTPAAAWDRLCRKNTSSAFAPSAVPRDDLVWVAGESASSEDDSEEESRSGEEEAAAEPSSSDTGRHVAKASGCLPSGRAGLGKRRASALAAAPRWRSSSGRHQQAAPPWRTRPARLLPWQASPRPAAESVCTQTAAWQAHAQGGAQAEEDVDSDGYDAGETDVGKAECEAARGSSSPSSSAGDDNMSDGVASGVAADEPAGRRRAQQGKGSSRLGGLQGWQSERGRMRLNGLQQLSCGPAMRQPDIRLTAFM